LGRNSLKSSGTSEKGRYVVLSLLRKSPFEQERVVRIEAASINPSDVKNVAGRMTQTTLAARSRP